MLSSSPPDDSDLQQASTKHPPHSIGAEQALIGGLLLDNTAWERIGDVVGEGDFYLDAHRRIFRHISRLIEVGRLADVLTASESIVNFDEEVQTGGMAYLAEIANNTPSAANIRRYAEIVRERAVLRKLLVAGNEIAASVLNLAGRDVKQILDDAEVKVQEIAEAGVRSTARFVAIQPFMAQVVEKIEELYGRDSGHITGTPTGFTDLDMMTSGLQPGDMIVVAGRPSMGKTSFALNIAEHVGVELKLPVAIFSLGTPGPQLAMRLLSSVGRIEHTKLRTACLTDDDWDKMTMALGKLHEANIHIDETGAINSNDLRARARRLYRQYGKLGLIVIDNLQLMTSAHGNVDRAAEISEISRSIKSLANELQVPVIALSQLSHKVEERNDKRPLMSDLRESGAIEQDADIIIMMYRDEYYNKDKPDNKGMAEAIVTMHRNGPTGTVMLTFLSEYTKFVNFSPAVAMSTIDGPPPLYPSQETTGFSNGLTSFASPPHLSSEETMSNKNWFQVVTNAANERFINYGSSPLSLEELLKKLQRGEFIHLDDLLFLDRFEYKSWSEKDKSLHPSISLSPSCVLSVKQFKGDPRTTSYR